MSVPLVFISYSHDSEEHKAWVRQLAADLRSNGIDAILDQWELSPGQDVSAFMQDGITKSDRVVMVCSSAYVTKADGGLGGVGYERLVVTGELVANIDTKKFLPLLRGNPGTPKTPAYLGPRLYIDFTHDIEYQARVEELLPELHSSPATSKPPLGPNPFSGSMPGGFPSSRATGPTGVTTSGEMLLDDPWFLSNEQTGAAGLGKLGFKGSMELRFALHSPTAKSQIDLLNAVGKSQIHTFGWPIGIVLDNREEFRPKPATGGIRAEISVAEMALTGRPSFDYWALRETGDFYLLQSLFEDDREAGAIFFNSRIVRVTEAFLFAANLYESLATPSETKVSIRVTHRGLSGRVLSSSNPMRRLFGRSAATVDVSQSQVVEEVGHLRDHLVANVRRIVEPLFMVFDFAQFDSKVYDDIVISFSKGQST